MSTAPSSAHKGIDPVWYELVFTCYDWPETGILHWVKLVPSLTNQRVPGKQLQSFIVEWMMKITMQKLDCKIQ